MYVVEINVKPSPESPESTVWRLLNDRQRAEKLWYQLDSVAVTEKTVNVDGTECQVLGARVWQVNTRERVAATAAIAAGDAKLLKTTENVICEISEEIIEWIKEPLLRLPPDDIS